MSLMLSLLLVQAAAAATPPSSDDVITVTATLRSLEDALERCKRGGCTPRQDIVASIRYAEAVFRSGRYQDARRVLQQSIGRNREGAKGDPAALSALYEATATVAAHDGEQKVVAAATGARVRALRDELPENDPRIFQAELDMADLRLSRNFGTEAMARYESLAKRVAAAGNANLLASIRLRQAQVAHAWRQDARAKRYLDQVIASADAAQGYRLAARAVAARFARDRGDIKATDALIASLTATPDSQPLTLLWQPPIPSPTNTVNLDYFNNVDNVTRGEAVSARWVDIGFLVKADGTVDPPEILRGTPGRDWAKPILGSIGQRRYAPPGNSSAAVYRVERWTLTADYDTPIGSLVRRRTRNPHFEQLDLTPVAP